MSVSPTPARAPAPPRLSVVIPTYRRPERVARLVGQLAEQTLAPGAFEVIVVDDGSPVDPRPRIEAVRPPYHLVIERQANQGPATARHRGVELARGEIVLFLDDDMIPSPQLLEAHLRVHDATPRAVVVGGIRPSGEIARLPIFERFHARTLDEHAAAVRASGKGPSGRQLCSGNLSMRRADYLAVGGFDRSLPQSEDAEIGIRLEKAGAAIRLAEDAYAVHDSDHTDLDGWLRRAFTYGRMEQRIARKHPDVPDADPWHWLELVSVLPRPAYALAVAAPRVGGVVGRAVMQAALGLDAIGLARPAQVGTMLAYGMEYYRGVRAEAGSASACARDVLRYRRRKRSGGAKPGARRAAIDHFLAAVRADHATLRRYDGKYDTRGRGEASLAHDLVERIGFQMLAAYRLMELLKEAGSPFAAKVAARVIRLIYGADVHWDAAIADGVALNHGMGLAISHAARIAKGTILSHNVSIGDGIDPRTRVVGAPNIEESVHIGPNAVLLGPITVGARSKIGPGVVLLESVPPDSLVEAQPPRIRQRAPRPAEDAPSKGAVPVARASAAPPAVERHP